jgi:DNA topoisomerase-1
VIVRLLDVTSLRVGNEEYARANSSFGLTTLRSKHVSVRGSTLHMAFTGKSKHRFDVQVENPRLARIVRRCQDLPGQVLFKYVADSGEVRTIGSADVNEYLASVAGAGTTAKTFRTWNATALAASHLVAVGSEGEAPTKRAVNQVIDLVASELGNTRAVCRTSYVHPAVVDGFLDGSLLRSWQRPAPQRPSGLSVDERRTLRYLTRATSSAGRC